MNQLIIKDPHGLETEWSRMQASTPRLRAYDAAEVLGVSEAELVSTRCGQNVIRLSPPWTELLQSLIVLRRVKTISRNAYAVHETIGVYENVQIVPEAGLVMSGGLDLRLLLGAWASGYAVRERIAGGATRRSLQFFDAEGVAVHKIYAEEDETAERFDEIVGAYADADQSPGQSVEPRTGAGLFRRDIASREELLEGWRALADTHEFAPLLRRLNVARLRAMELAEGEFTRRLAHFCVEELLKAAAAREIPIMVFVENRGVVQIFTGEIRDVRMLGPWLNILDPAFNLHLRFDAIDSVWAVEKPTTDGTVTSVELYAADGTNIVTFFGARKPGKPELSEWRALVSVLQGVAS